MTRRDDEHTRQGGESSGGGPFPGPAFRSALEAAETERGPFERRRGGDRRAQETGESAAGTGERPSRIRPWGRRRVDVVVPGAGTALSRGRVMVRRFREPLIGLTLAGLAVPLINAGMVPLAEEAKAGAKGGEAALAERDLDASVGEYWAEAEEAVVRSQTIEGAATRWGIAEALAVQIYDAAARHDIEPDVAFGLVFVESTFRERAVSHVGARGLAQVMPRTARWLDPSVRTQDLFKPDVNLDLGFRYLRMMIDKYDGDVRNALTAYNRGPGTVDRVLRRGGNPDNGYAGKVLSG